MIIMVCVDDNNGMMFNKRRQSQDRVLRQRMLELAGEKKLWMNDYSRRQFPEEEADRIAVTGPDFSDQDPAQYEAQIEELILFHWNRVYPADLHSTLDLSGWNLTETEEFAGNSHEKITQERYVRG